MKNKNLIPKYKNIREEADFWDKNDVTDFMTEMKEVKVKFSPKILKEESIVIRVRPRMKKRLEMIALDKGLTLSTMLLVERLRVAR